MNELKNIVLQLVSLLTTGEEHLKNIYTDNLMPFSKYIQEFRTIKLNLPRRTDKSTILRELHSIYSSRLYNIVNKFDLNAEISPLRNTNYLGLKFKCFLLDEYSGITPDIMQYIEELKLRNLLEKDFFVLIMSTDK